MTITMDFQTMFAEKQNTTGRRLVATGFRTIVKTTAMRDRAERLARLKAQIADGTYFVPSADVAASVMRSMMKG